MPSGSIRRTRKEPLRPTAEKDRLSLHVVRQMAGRPPRRGPCGPFTTLRRKPQARAPGAQRAPPAQEEDPRVKCGDCGAFGHKASSLRCPMKRWDGARAPQPPGSQKMKENRKPWTARDPGHPGPAPRAAGRKEQRPRPESRQRQALLQAFPRRPLGPPQPPSTEPTASCDYTRSCEGPLSPPGPAKGQGVPAPGSRHPAGTGCVRGPGSGPHGPGRALIGQAEAKRPHVGSPGAPHPADHRSGQDSDVRIKAPGKRAAQTPPQSCQRPRKKPRCGPCPPPGKSRQGADPGRFRPLRPPARAPGLTPAEPPRAPRETPAPGRSAAPGPPHAGPLLSTVQACPVSPLPPAPQRPGQPLRVVFTRSDKGQWRSRLLRAPWVPPAEGPAPPAQSPPAPGASGGLCARVPFSIL
ncbi:protein FAM90A1-like [Pteronotus mesoamericanus]|uniref:protein FAM90A1-like n=1 Tax=Pteronotus mesoamericanus TaxID=1884717 RepID=UPI0023ECD5C7|nr:protein FAM90A1-like [Pteronotus parnellii mesoamericanus]